MNQLHTIEECADILQVSTKWLYQTAIPKLEFPARKLGRSLRVDASALAEWWTNQPSAGE